MLVSAFHGRGIAHEFGAPRNKKVSVVIAIVRSALKYKVPVDERTHMNKWNRRLRRNMYYLKESTRINEEVAGGEMQSVPGGV